MRSITAKLVIGVAITTIGMYGADNSIGTWKRNVEKSTSKPPNPNPITSLTVTGYDICPRHSHNNSGLVGQIGVGSGCRTGNWGGIGYSPV